MLGETYAEVGRSIRGFLAGGSAVHAGRVVVEEDALYLSWVGFVASEVLDALEMESRILWNFRFVVLRAVVPVGIFGRVKRRDQSNGVDSRVYGAWYTKFWTCQDFGSGQACLSEGYSPDKALEPTSGY